MEQTQNNWKRKTVLFLISQCITLFGSMIVQMSIIWYVTLKTSSGGWVAAFTICSYLPQFLISFFAGVWADRYSHKKLIILFRWNNHNCYPYHVFCNAYDFFRFHIAKCFTGNVYDPFHGSRCSDAGSECGDTTPCTGGISDEI